MPYLHAKGRMFLIHAEEIFWIVLCLDLLQAAVVWAICRCHRLARLIIAEIVHVSGRSKKRLHLRECLARPSNAPIIVRLIQPFTQYQEIVAFRAMRKCRVIDTDPGSCTVNVLK